MSPLLAKLIPVFVQAAFTKKNVVDSNTTKAAAIGALTSITAFATMDDLIVGIGGMIISTILFFLNDDKPAEPTIEHGQDK